MASISLCRVHQNVPIPSISKRLPLSPPPPFILPVYAEEAAAMMSLITSPRPRHELRLYNSAVLKYLDLEAEEVNGSEYSSGDSE
jgi:hypothetical protein